MRVLYLEGDPHSLRYLSGSLARLGVAHEIAVPSTSLPRELSRFKAVILSAFPRARLRGFERLLLRGLEEGGLGLLFVGGCGSFGHGGYAAGELSGSLPVHIEEGDDRVARPGGVLLEPVNAHPILRGLSWSQPIAICGHHLLSPKPGSSTALAGRAIERDGASLRLARERVPLLVLGEGAKGRGRVAALGFSLAPSWSGGLTEWGDKFLRLEEAEVGDHYMTFVMNLLRWVAGEDVLRRPMPGWERLGELPRVELTSPSIRCEKPPR